MLAFDLASDEERWGPVDGFPSFQVSSRGRLARVRTQYGNPCFKILKCKVGPAGYHLAEFRVNNELHYRTMGRMVLEAFVGPPPTDKHEAAHGDGDPGNNLLSNLRWATPSENNLDKRAHGTMPRGEKHKWTRLTEADVKVVRMMAASGVPLREICRSLGKPKQTVFNVIHRKSWVHLP